MEGYTGPTQSPQAPANVPFSEEEHRGKATTAMVLAIVGLALLVLPGFNLPGLILSIIGLCMAVKNRRLAAASGMKEHSNNTTAFVCGLIGVIVHGALFALVFLGIILALAIGVTAINAIGPSIGAALTEGAPAIRDAIRDALPAVESIVIPFLGL